MKLMIRKVQYAPDAQGEPPSVEITKDFVMSDKPLHVKVALDKEVSFCTSVLRFNTLKTFILAVEVR